MNDSSQQNQSIFPFVLLAILSAVAIFDASTPLDTLRPRQPERGDEKEIEVDNLAIDTRIWQDPFHLGKIIEDQQRPAEDGPQWDIDNEDDVLFLSIVLSDQLKASSRESRVRRRYAAHQALSHAGYRAVHPDRVYTDRFECYGKDRRMVMELFEKDMLSPRWYNDRLKVMGTEDYSVRFGEDSENHFDVVYDKVVVLYLKSGDLAKEPLQYLKEFVCEMQFRPYIKDTGCLPAFRFIGPVDSGQVYEFLKEAESKAEGFMRLKHRELEVENAYEFLIEDTLRNPTRPKALRSPESSIYMFSPIATADFETLRGQKTGGIELNTGFIPKQIKTLQSRLMQLGVARDWLDRFLGFRYLRTVHNDSSVLAEILRELELRQLIVDEDDLEKVALIIESDTRYGRAMPVNFLKGAEQVFGKPNFRESFEYRMDKLRVFPYISGLDGNLPTLSTKSESEAPRSTTVPGMGESSLWMPPKVDWQDPAPHGYHQVDYIRRLAQQVKRHLQNAESPIRAIGILGTDVYDKLLLMRALKPVLGEVAFFTTDLDARLWHSSEIEYTRNLIVGSSHSLRFAPEIQRFVPPFRDSYQASIFASVLAATNALSHPYEIERYEPQVFEISEKGPVYLRGGNFRRGEIRDSTPSEGVALFDTSHPNYQTRALVSWVVGYALTFVMIIVFENTVRRRYAIQGVKSPYSRLKWILFFVFVCGMFAFGSIDNEDYEPISLFGGISAWVGFCINIFAAVLAACFCIYISNTRYVASSNAFQHWTKFRLAESEGQVIEGEPGTTQSPSAKADDLISQVQNLLERKLSKPLQRLKGYSGFFVFLSLGALYGYIIQYFAQEGMLSSKWGWFLAPILVLIGLVAFGFWSSISSFYQSLEDRKSGTGKPQRMIKKPDVTGRFSALVADKWKIRTFLLPLLLLLVLSFTWALYSGYNYLPLRTLIFKRAFELSQLLQVGTMLALLSYVTYEAVWVTAVVLKLSGRDKNGVVWDPYRIMRAHEQLDDSSQKPSSKGTEQTTSEKANEVSESQAQPVNKKRLQEELREATRCVQFISELTEVPNRYLTFPFIVLLFYFISQSTDFEGWAWTQFRFAVAASLFIVCLVPATLMRLSALYLRRQALQYFGFEKIREAVGREPPNEDELVENLKAIRRGAYAPLVNQPIVYAILTPLGGMGSFALVKLLLDSIWLQ